MKILEAYYRKGQEAAADLLADKIVSPTDRGFLAEVMARIREGEAPFDELPDDHVPATLEDEWRSFWIGFEVMLEG